MQSIFKSHPFFTHWTTRRLTFWLISDSLTLDSGCVTSSGANSMLRIYRFIGPRSTYFSPVLTRRLHPLPKRALLPRYFYVHFVCLSIFFIRFIKLSSPDSLCQSIPHTNNACSLIFAWSFKGLSAREVLLERYLFFGPWSREKSGEPVGRGEENMAQT